MSKKGIFLNGSIYGETPHKVYDYVNFINNKLNDNPKILVVDCKDGQVLRTFANKGYDVTGYEANEKYLNGGIFEVAFKDNDNIYQTKERTIIGLNKVLANNDNINLINENFYKTKIKDKYDFIYVYKSLHRSCNQDIKMDEKIKKLLSCVKDNGYIYFYYHMAKDENDFVNYPVESYLRENEISEYINNSYSYIHLLERDTYRKDNPHYGRLYEHDHKVGYVLLQKKKRKINEMKSLKYVIKVGKNFK